MPTAAKIARNNANPARAGQVSVPMASGSVGGVPMSTPQINATGAVFWQIGSPLVAGQNPHPYPTLE